MVASPWKSAQAVRARRVEAVVDPLPKPLGAYFQSDVSDAQLRRARLGDDDLHPLTDAAAWMVFASLSR